MREGTTRFSAGLFVIVLLFASAAEAKRGNAPLVNSFNGRTGDVVSITGDYSFPLITGTAVKSQLPSLTAFTDQTNSFTANQSITGNLSLTGTINLPRTSSSSAGVINFGGIRFIHNSGTNTGSC